MTQNDGAFVTCRGPLFVDCFNRYDFELPGVKGSIRVIAPKTVAAGNPWVYRADGVSRDDRVACALLSKGFHIVTGPVPYDTNNLSLPNWNTVYKHLTDHGLSKKVVMSGIGGAAGEAYAWAIENPEKVACVYVENPIMTGTLSKMPLIDNLAPLAKAGIPLLHVCGSLDPHLEGQSRAVEKRYKDLGGKVTILITDKAEHFPSVADHLNSIVEFILNGAK